MPIKVRSVRDVIRLLTSNADDAHDRAEGSSRALAGPLSDFAKAHHTERLAAQTARAQAYTEAARRLEVHAKLVKALEACESLLDSVAFVAHEGDTDKPLQMAREALRVATGRLPE